MVTDFFREICSIPRGSGFNTLISDYLVEFAKDRKMKYFRDDYENVVIFKEGSPGYENCCPLIIQGHMDMVCEKVQGSSHDFITEGLELIENEKYLRANGTTLGADDGIALAYMLELLSDDSIIHPPLEMVFTTDEEIGMIGAKNFDASILKGKHLINIDSEEEGIFIAGCAGGMTVKTVFPVKREKRSGIPVSVVIKGLKGGHSGADIHKNRTNAVILMGRMLFDEEIALCAGLVSIEGGNKDNVIPNGCTAELIVSESRYNEFKGIITKKIKEIEKELAVSEPGIKIGFVLENRSEIAADVLDCNSFNSLIRHLNVIPNGIRVMSPDIEGMVDSSLNLGVLRLSETDDAVTIINSVRSRKKSYIEYMKKILLSLASLCGGTMEVYGEYPGYDMKSSSVFRDIMCDAYESVAGRKPVVSSIHAGLEIGVFSEKIDGLDIISLGADVHDIHTVNEKLDLESFERMWQFIKTAVTDFAKKNKVL